MQKGITDFLDHLKNKPNVKWPNHIYLETKTENKS